MGGSQSHVLSEELQRKFPSFKSVEELQEVFLTAELSRIIYANHYDIPRLLEEVAYHPWFTPESYQLSLPKAPQKVLLMKDSHKLYAVFSGTQSWNDWVVDLAATLKPFPLLPGTLVHHGFASRFMNTPWRAIEEAAIKMQSGSSQRVKIILCGHSLAGAVAQLVATCLLLHNNMKFDIHCYTFGQPLVGVVTHFIETNKWQNHFHCFYHVRDPIPFIFREIPRMAPFGTLVMLSDQKYSPDNPSEYQDAEFSVISPEIFRRHQWRANGTFSVQNVKNMTKVVQESVEMKKYHSMENYYRIITDLFRGCENLLPNSKKTKKNSIIAQDIAVVPVLSDCRGKFLESGDLQVVIQGTYLQQIALAYLTVQSSRGDSTSEFRSVFIQSIDKSSISTRFVIPKDSQVDSSRGIISVSNYFTILQRPCILPFNTVWLVGKSGAGKTQLRTAFESNEAIASEEPEQEGSQTNALLPKAHVVPDRHEEYERSYERNRVHYYEFNGFTDFTGEDTKGFLSALHNHPPRLILLVINATDTIRETERNKLREFLERIRSINLPVWFVFTHFSMVDDRIRESVIEQVKKELKIEPSDKCYFVDSVTFRSGNIVIPPQGVQCLQHDLETYLLTVLNTSILSDNSYYRNLLEAAKAFVLLGWRNKQTIIASVTTMSTLAFYLYKLRSRM